MDWCLLSTACRVSSIDSASQVRLRKFIANGLVDPFVGPLHISVSLERTSRPSPDGRLPQQAVPVVSSRAEAVWAVPSTADVRGAAGRELAALCVAST